MIGAAVIAAIILNMPAGRKTQQNNILLYWLLLFAVTSSVIYIRFLGTTDLRDLGIAAISGFFIGLIVTSVAEKLKKKRVIRTV